MSDFHMVVCVKAVPGSTEVKMDPKTNTIVRDGKQAVINPFDASALECALALKDDFIGFGMDVRVTVVSMGIPATESLLREHKKGIVDAQFQQKRISAAISDIYAQVAVLSRVTSIFEDQGVEPSGQERYIADSFCQRAAGRVRSQLRQMERNDDDRMTAIAKLAYKRGEYGYSLFTD